MRFAIALFAVGIGLASSYSADPFKKTATVEVDGVEVRSGHALGFPAVRQLQKGDSVIIVREEETGFYAIEPPTGSVSWIKQIHLAKIEPAEGGKANVPVAVEGAEILAGYEKENKPTNRITTRLPKGTIVETLGPSVRIDNASWYPIVPPEGDLRWIPKAAIRSASLRALASTPPYAKPDKSPFTVVPGTTNKTDTATPVVATLPRVLTDHRLWAQASQAEQSKDIATARTLYARIYQDLWDQKAERDAIVICYNRYSRCDEAIKKGDRSSLPTIDLPGETRSSATSTGRTGNDSPKWSNAGYLNEVQRVFVDGQQVYSLQDDGNNVLYYLTGVTGVNLKNFKGRRVQVYGVASQRPELYRPHIAVERLELAKN